MKKLKKIALAFVLSLILGITTNVYAKQADEESLNVLPDMFDINMTETDYKNDSMNVNSQISNTIKTTLTENNIEYEAASAGVAGDNVSNDGYYIIYVSITIKQDDESYKSYYRKIKANFTDSSTNASKRAELLNKLAKYKNDKLYYLVKNESVKVTGDDVFNSFTKEIKSLFNDDTLKITVSSGRGSTLPEGEEPKVSYVPIKNGEWINDDAIVEVYKDDIIKVSMPVNYVVGVGCVSEDGKNILVSKIDETNSNYSVMKNLLNEKGYSNIIQAYELKLADGTINGKLSVNIPVDTKYNGKEVIILHKKADGTYEEFTTAVKDGNASIEVTELSPFMVALKDSTSGVTKLSNNAQTSSINIVLLSVLAVMSLVGIIYIIVSKRKKIA